MERPEEYMEQEYLFDYDDIMLLPGEGVLHSRSEADITFELGERVFSNPIIPANMSSIIDEKTVYSFLEANMFYVMHRFNIDALAFVQKMHSEGHYASISVGIKQEDINLLRQMQQAQAIPEYITIDVAHGHCEEVINQIYRIRSLFGSETFIIAGNIATPEAALALAEAGANAVKVGVAPGSVCLTGPNTGFGTRGWQLSAVAFVARELSCSSYYETVIIADGGIKHPGDIAKSIAFGADLVMIGGIFSSHEESPGETIMGEDGQRYKAFYGSASAEQKGDRKHVEGKKILNPVKGSLADTIAELQGHLQSSVSYSGGTSLSDLRSVYYVKIR